MSSTETVEADGKEFVGPVCDLDLESICKCVGVVCSKRQLSSNDIQVTKSKTEGRKVRLKAYKDERRKVNGCVMVNSESSKLNAIWEKQLTSCPSGKFRALLGSHRHRITIVGRQRKQHYKEVTICRRHRCISEGNSNLELSVYEPPKLWSSYQLMINDQLDFPPFQRDYLGFFRGPRDMVIVHHITAMILHIML